MLAIPGAVAMEALEPSDMDAGVAAHYGDPLREQRQLATGVGLVDRSNRGVLAVSGADRLSWLHSLTTQHLTDLPPYQGTELLVLSPHGHVEYHASVLDDATTTWLDVEPGTGPGLPADSPGKSGSSGLSADSPGKSGSSGLSADSPGKSGSSGLSADSPGKSGSSGLLDFLNRMRFMLRVEPADLSAQWALLSLVGPSSVEAAARLGVTLTEPATQAPVPGPKFASADVRAAATSRYPSAALPGGGFARRMPYGVDLLVPRAALAATVATLAVPLAGLWAFEALRVADRRPRLGRETDHRTLPAEAGWLGGGVHLDKGCYRGQETVARVHNLGRPPRRLVLLHLDGITTDELPAQGTPVTAADGRTVGFVGTAAHHYELGSIALALVKQNVAADAVLTVGPSAAAIDPS